MMQAAEDLVRVRRETDEIKDRKAARRPFRNRLLGAWLLEQVPSTHHMVCLQEIASPMSTTYGVVTGCHQDADVRWETSTGSVQVSRKRRLVS